MWRLFQVGKPWIKICSNGLDTISASISCLGTLNCVFKLEKTPLALSCHRCYASGFQFESHFNRCHHLFMTNTATIFGFVRLWSQTKAIQISFVFVRMRSPFRSIKVSAAASLSLEISTENWNRELITRAAAKKVWPALTFNFGKLKSHFPGLKALILFSMVRERVG